MLQIFIPFNWNNKQEFFSSRFLLVLCQFCNMTLSFYFLVVCYIRWNILFIIWKWFCGSWKIQPRAGKCSLKLAKDFLGNLFFSTRITLYFCPADWYFGLASNCCRVLGLRGQSVAQVQAAAFVGKPSAVGNHCRQLLKTTIAGKYCWQLF